MTSPYTPEFEFTDWPNGPLRAELPPTNSPNLVLNRVEAEFGNVAAAFAELGGLRDAVNALLAGRLPTTPFWAVPSGVGQAHLNRAVLLDGTGGLVVCWASTRVNNRSQVYASRLDLAHPESRFSPVVAVTSGATVAAVDPTAVVLPNGELVVAYTSGGAVMMKRAALSGLPDATARTVSAAGGGDNPHAVLAGDQVVFFFRTSTGGRWSYRRYNHVTAGFLDTAPVQFSTDRLAMPHRGLHAAASDDVVSIAYTFRDGDDSGFLHGRRLDTAAGTISEAIPVDHTDSPPYVLPVDPIETVVFHNDGTRLRATTIIESAQHEAVTVPGTGAGDRDPVAVWDDNRNLYVFYTRPDTRGLSMVMLSVRWNTGEWGPPQRVGHLFIADGMLQPVFAPGQGLWLVNGNRADVSATRLIAAV